MQRNINSRIDFLMKITGTSNAQLARALSYDASYISRVRSGKRGLPPELPFIEPAAAFFARNVREDYQADALAHEMGLSGKWPDDVQEASDAIASWLDAAGEQAKQGLTDAASADDLRAVAPGQHANAALFFGNQGRREAALTFLSQIAESMQPCEVLLQSDESTTWMYEDPAFARELVACLTNLASIGCTFTVVHTVSRDGNEMWEGVRGWLPLYLTGSIKPYYYPRLRDGVRSRSLFVARGVNALVSSSVQGMEGDELSILLDDADAVIAMENEFDAYLKLCQQLATLIRVESRTQLESLVAPFTDAQDSVAAVVFGGVLCASAGKRAIFVTPEEHPFVYQIDEPRLTDAVASYIEHLPETISVENALSHVLTNRSE